MQVCVQGLLLREHGYECVEGALYFAETNQRVRVELTDELVARTRELIADARRVAVEGTIPPPLARSPKCPRCSLVGICLPDETNLLREATAEGLSDKEVTAEDEVASPTKAEGEPRRLFPARDDALAVYVQGQGYSVGLRGEVLEIREKGKAVSSARLLETNQLCLFGNVQLSAQALHELAGRGVPVIHMSYGGWLTAVTTPPPHKNIELRRRQFKAADDREFCLRLARAIVSGKIRNSRTLLRRNARELPRETLVRLGYARRDAERAASLEQLLGIEGAAARDYFAKFSSMFKTNGGRGYDTEPLEEESSSVEEDVEQVSAPPDSQPWARFDFTKRNRRPPRDPVNALLSFVYAMLAKDLLATLVTHPHFGYAISYRRIFEVQARLLARHLTGEINFYPAFCTRQRLHGRNA